MKRVIVLLGGWSSEREVSLSSGKGICDALTQNGYYVIPIDPSPDLYTLVEQIKSAAGDVVFNALHGKGGEDGTIQVVLDLARIPYTHSGMMASAAGMNKAITKAIVSQVGVPITESYTVIRSQLKNGHPMGMPYVVKPVDDGSSVGVTIVKNDADLQLAILGGQEDQIVLVEKFIPGEELTVAVTDLFSKEKQAVALGVTMLKPQNDFYDFSAKYTSGATAHLLNPDLPLDVISKLKDYAVRAHVALGCRMVSRSDFRYNSADGIVFLETNTHPGFTPLSLLPEQALANGISFQQLVVKMVEAALEQ